MVTTRRIDRAQTGILSAFRREEDGSIHVVMDVRRQGILEYRNADGSIRRELVSQKALEDTAASGGRAVLTLTHPAKFVDPNNYADVTVGDVDGDPSLERSAQGGFVRVRGTFRKADAIAALVTGEAREISCGYEVDLDETPGEDPIYGRYDAIQIGTRVNHFALVPAGRAGDQMRAHYDSADILVGAYVTTPSTSRIDMNKLYALALLVGATPRADAADPDLHAAINDGITKMKKDMGEAIAAKTKADDDLAMLLKELGFADLPALKAAYLQLKGESAANAAKVAEHEAKERVIAEQAMGAKLDKLAAYTKASIVGCKTLDAKRLAIARSRVDTLDASTPADVLNGVLSVIEADMKRADASEGRVDHLADVVHATDPKKDAADAEFANPTRKARTDAFHTAGA